MVTREEYRPYYDHGWIQGDGTVSWDSVEEEGEVDWEATNSKHETWCTQCEEDDSIQHEPPNVEDEEWVSYSIDVKCRDCGSKIEFIVPSNEIDGTNVILKPPSLH